MTKSSASEGESASKLISNRIAELGDWRGETLGRMRKLIKAADPDVVEEWKWMGTPVWSHDGIICTGESYKKVVKLTFAKGASLKDPARLFNSSLVSRNLRRRRSLRHMMANRLFIGCLVSACTVACARTEGASAPAYEVTARFPHDSTSYTQGLVWADSILYESTGRYGYSELRRVDLRSGRVLASRSLAANRFGEGLALVKGRLFQLTWQSGVAYVYDAATLAPRDSFTYAGEGWGLATDGASLFMSDGSDSLRILSPATFHTDRVVHVRYKGAPLYKLNELEYVDGSVLANVYESNWVVRIDPASGEVRELLDFADLYPDRAASAEVMNGIALSPDKGQLLLTGKLWPVMFQVRFRPSSAPR
jgi:glutamine cyclotransferase